MHSSITAAKRRPKAAREHQPSRQGSSYLHACPAETHAVAHSTKTDADNAASLSLSKVELQTHHTTTWCSSRHTPSCCDLLVSCRARPRQKRFTCQCCPPLIRTHTHCIAPTWSSQVMPSLVKVSTNVATQKTHRHACRLCQPSTMQMCSCVKGTLHG